MTRSPQELAQSLLDDIEAMADWGDEQDVAVPLGELRALAEAGERAQEALREIAFGFDGDEWEDTADAFDRQKDIARAALGEGS